MDRFDIGSGVVDDESGVAAVLMGIPPFAGSMNTKRLPSISMSDLRRRFSI